ncbi:MAG: C-GCAxxG-C-C family protein [Ruminiclostridium sp.]
MCNKLDSAVQCFNNGFNCSQAVFTTYCEELGLDTETALKISGAFGGGMGHIGETCGAVTGAFMLIGLKYGKFKAEDNSAKEKTYSLVQEFTKNFKADFGSVKCKELVKYDISISGEMQKAREAGVFGSICPMLVKRAIEIIEDIL